MMALSRSAAGTWCGASHAGHAIAETGLPSSSARAALETTSRAGACAPGASVTASGSGTGTSCSDRIRGQRAAVRTVELQGFGDEVVRRLTAVASPRKLGPD